MAEHLADYVDGLQCHRVAHDDAHVRAEFVSHYVEHPPGVFELFSQADAQLVVGRHERRIDRRRVTPKRALFGSLLLGAKLGLNRIDRGLCAAQMGWSTEIMLTTHDVAFLDIQTPRLVALPNGLIERG